MYSDGEEQKDEEKETGALGLVPYKLCMLCVLIVIYCAGATSRKRASAFEKQHPALARSLEGFSQDTQEDDYAEQGEQRSNVQRFVAYQGSKATIAVCTSNLDPESMSTSTDIYMLYIYMQSWCKGQSSGPTMTFLVDIPHKHLHTCLAHYQGVSYWLVKGFVTQ